MRNHKTAANPYQKFYMDPRFEREGLFQLLQVSYHPTEVLYPGCSYHITPAFYFPHVVFVDQDPAAREFFSNQEMVLDLVKRQRVYKRSPYLQFIFQDFTQPLPVPENQFDLLLGLYASGVSKACKSYLKTGGLYLTNNHQDDAVEASQDKELTLIAMLQERQGKYQLVDFAPGGLVKIGKQTRQSKRYLRQTSGGVEYIESEIYYLFRRKLIHP